MTSSATSTSPNLPLPSFDELVRLAKEDPQALDKLRHTHAEALINAASPRSQPHLRALQGHIDRCISTGKNPLHTCVLLNRLLMRQLGTLQQALNRPSEFMEQQAQILPFGRNARNTDTSSITKASVTQTPPSPPNEPAT
ncbi:DUF3135 domain-containing protein [Plesiomonas shigelloides]|uniref:DUF3135 domain-containing protein n=1 Tax=Plesiomonas shigelloides TaxID=703 RepID=UPI001C043535|nr:DUF3135 domain-containing protein [Plesiomonas shigelloides]QWK98301.1 DUF3135 domain-containing protein [Plesiomonas shigelloides]